MPRPIPRAQWVAEADQRFAALETWRREHPTATWTEIEAAIDGELSQLRARMLGETAMTSDAVDLDGERPCCPDCGMRLELAGSRRRRLRTEQERPVAIERTYARCPACGVGLFPPG